MEKKSLLLIGNGSMGSSFIKEIRSFFNITIVSPNSKPSYLCKYYKCLSLLTAPQDIIIFGVKPFQISTVIKKLNPDCYSQNTIIISLIAGANTSFFKENLQKKCKIYRCMANLPVRNGKGIVAVYGPEKLDFLEKLGQIIYCSNEDEIDKYTSIIGSGSGFVFHLLSTYEKATKELGVGKDVDSTELIMNLFEGSLLMARERISKDKSIWFFSLIKGKKTNFQSLKKEVVTPNGTTHAGLQELKKADQFFSNCISKAYARANNLGEELNKKLLHEE